MELTRSFVLAADVLERLQERHRRLGFPLTAKGARGHVVAHPLFGELRRQAAHVTDLARGLGLARSPQRVMVGKNMRAPDRVAKLRSVK